VYVVVYAPNIPQDRVVPEFRTNGFLITFLVEGSWGERYKFELDHLFGNIVPDQSVATAATKKVEIAMKKELRGHWRTLKESALPNSSKKN